jgi:hypothetical protein
MLNDLENSIIASVKDLNASLPAENATAFTETESVNVRIEAAKIMMKLRERFMNDEKPMGEEFFMAYCAALSPELRDIFIVGGLESLSQIALDETQN